MSAPVSAPLAVDWSEGLRRWEERALLACCSSGAVGAAYGFEAWLLVIPVVLTVLLFPVARSRRLRATQGVEGLLLVFASLLALPLVLEGGAPAPGLALFLIAAQSVKLLAPRTERDKGTACLIGVALAGVSASEAVEPPIAVMLLASVTSTAAFAILRNIRFHGRPSAPEELGLGGAEPAPRGPRWTGRVRTWRGARGLLWLSAAAALGSTVFFFTFPRFGAKLFSSARSGSSRMAGFTDRVGLSDIGKIKQNNAVAFRVEAPPARFGEDTFWKGRALDYYDGKTWRSSRLFRLTKQNLKLRGRLRFYDREVKGDEGAEPEEFTFLLEPLGTRCLFTTGLVEEFQFKSRRPLALTRDDLGSILLGKPFGSPIAYVVKVYPRDRSSLALHKARAFKVRQHCLRIPTVIDAVRLKDYSALALRDQRVAQDSPAAEIARGLAAHLRSRFRYTLDIRSAGGAEPIADFLYARREGHCELFASAHVMLLRARGIPARLITGFRGGTYSEWTESYTVRQRDAHAWVEALTENGWETFDPTPAEAPVPRRSELVEVLSAAKNWLELRWFSRVIAFDSYDQENFLIRVQSWVALRAGLEDHSQAVARALILSVLTLLGVGVFLALRLLTRPWRRRDREALAGQHGERSRAPSDEELAALLAELAARGFRREAWETPLELALRARKLASGARIEAWMRGYYARRYGGARGGGDRNGGGAHAGLASLLDDLRATRR